MNYSRLDYLLLSKVRQMQNVSENFILLFFHDFRILQYRFGGPAKGILSKGPVFYFLFEFEVGWTRLETS